MILLGWYTTSSSTSGTNSSMFFLGSRVNVYKFFLYLQMSDLLAFQMSILSWKKKMFARSQENVRRKRPEEEKQFLHHDACTYIGCWFITSTQDKDCAFSAFLLSRLDPCGLFFSKLKSTLKDLTQLILSTEEKHFERE